MSALNFVEKLFIEPYECEFCLTVIHTVKIKYFQNTNISLRINYQIRKIIRKYTPLWISYTLNNNIMQMFLPSGNSKQQYKN